MVSGHTAGDGSEGAEDEETGDQPAMTDLVSSLAVQGRSAGYRAVSPRLQITVSAVRRLVVRVRLSL